MTTDVKETERAAEADSESLDSPSTNELLEQLLKRIDTLGTEQAKLRTDLDRRAPNFQPMERPQSSGNVRTYKEVIDEVSQGILASGGKQLAVGINGRRMNDEILAMLNPRFQQGEQVRLNPNAYRDGAQQTWSEVLAEVGAPDDLLGVVRKVLYFDSRGQWVYRCQFPHITTADGMTFQDMELLPSYG